MRLIDKIYWAAEAFGNIVGTCRANRPQSSAETSNRKPAHFEWPTSPNTVKPWLPFVLTSKAVPSATTNGEPRRCSPQRTVNVMRARHLGGTHPSWKCSVEEIARIHVADVRVLGLGYSCRTHELLSSTNVQKTSATGSFLMKLKGVEANGDRERATIGRVHIYAWF